MELRAMKAITRFEMFGNIIQLLIGVIRSLTAPTPTLGRDTTKSDFANVLGISSLTNGTNGGIVNVVSSGIPRNDFSIGSAMGVNALSSVELIDPAGPTMEIAFNTPNKDSVDPTLTGKKTVDSGAGKKDGDSDVELSERHPVAGAMGNQPPNMADSKTRNIYGHVERR